MENLTPQQIALRDITRRSLLKMAGYGIGSLALGSMLSQEASAKWVQDQKRTDPMAPKPPHFAPKAKAVINLFMAGAPSQLDLFDPKPTLQEHDGEPIPEEIIKDERFAFIKGVPKLLGSPHTFSKCGESGQVIGDLLPHTQEIADEICIIRSMHTDQFNHAPAQIYMNTGHQLPGRPSIGAWLTYGLGSEAYDLPGFVVLISGDNSPDGGKAAYGSGFLSGVYQGVEFRSQGDPVLFVSNPDGVTDGARRSSIDAINDLNRMRLAVSGDPEIDTRISSYELAYRMQSSVPELMSIESEGPEVHEMYGTKPGEATFANNCLLARRLVERGTRFVQLYHWGWDSHGTSDYDDLITSLPLRCKQTDRAAAALVKDLKRLGMLDETLVVWGGEFGRTPMNEERNGSKFKGRDHHPHAFSVWMAGGGVKPGVTYGATDELGYSVVEDAVHIHDLNATILHLMGFDHTRLTYSHLGRDFRLTDVYGNVVHDILA
ncbi:MAG: DUF1501 domain-containing protein [Armatimonadetes bacterium]|nr:DUF1501 domain-containing protein [Armatimonadota bacterium]